MVNKPRTSSVPEVMKDFPGKHWELELVRAPQLAGPSKAKLELSMNVENVQDQDSLSNATQHNATHPRLTFSKINELPQAGLKPMILYMYIRVEMLWLNN